MKSKSQSPSSFLLSLRVVLILLACACLIYIATLLVTMPASVALRFSDLDDEEISVNGTVWRGNAVIPAGYSAGWELQPFSSLASFAPVLEFTLDGPQTDLAGRAILRRAVRLKDVEGRADLSLLSALGISLPYECDTQMRISVEEAVWSENRVRLNSTLSSGAGECSDGTESFSHPPLDLTVVPQADASVGRLVTREDPDTSLVDFTLGEDRQVSVTVTPEGQALVSGEAASGPVTIEMPL